MKPCTNRNPCAIYDNERYVDIPGTNMSTILWWNSVCGKSSEETADWVTCSSGGRGGVLLGVNVRIGGGTGRF